MFLTRRQYDALVTHCRNWMDLRWSEYRRNWSYGGVHVCGSAGAIENLREQIAYCESRERTIKSK